MKTSRGRKGREAEDVSDFCAPADGRNGSNLSENINSHKIIVHNSICQRVKKRKKISKLWNICRKSWSQCFSSYFPLVSSRAIGRPENSGGGGNSHVLCIICFPNRNRVNVLDMISVEGYHPPPPFSDGLSLRINVNVRHLSTMLFEIAVQYRVVCNLWVWYLLRIGLHLHFWS